MSVERESQEHPTRWPVGTRVGPWRVVARQGQGAYGVVYRAVRVGREHEGPVALKVAAHAWDQRLTREAELLSRLSHPGVPRLLDRGVWRDAAGWEHPWLVMEWVEGTLLYAWARRHALSSRQVCLLLAHLARALEAVHAGHAVHRDIKGDNVLVRQVDGRPVLIDFSSGHFQGASRLTWRSLPPCTPAYLSPEAWMFYIRSRRDPEAYYPPAPADDVFALGVTAYRLVMGEYPPAMKPHEDEQGEWQVTCADARPFLERNPRVEPRLRELILRMLSASPGARGSAAELAQELEAAAGTPAPRLVPEPPWALSAWPVLVAAGAAGVLLWTARPVFEHEPAKGQEAAASHAPDAGAAAVGDSAPTAPRASAQAPSKQKPVAQTPAFQPRAGQARPDAKGRCPGRKQVVINGACWVEFPTTDAEKCAEGGHDFLEGKCYVPVLPPRSQPPPTSSPADAR
jgi:predicted Ser/Thr protein kinase